MPFRRVSEVEVFRGWIFTVGRAELVDPDGRSFERFIVHHPGAVTIVPVDADRRVTLVRQYRASVDRMMLEVPAGTCDVANESARGGGAPRAGRGGGPARREDGGPDRDLQHAGDQRPAHDDLSGNGPVPLPAQADGRRGGVHDDRDDRPRRRRRSSWPTARWSTRRRSSGCIWPGPAWRTAAP